MAVNDFGVTAAKVAAMYFPQWTGGFSASSNPTSTTVGLIVEESAAVLEGRLYGENITASEITTTTSAAYIMCAGQLRRMTALRIFRETTQQNPELAKSLETEIDAWFAQLAEKGGTFLGDESLNGGTSDPDGPTSHITQYSLTTDSAENMSTTVPRLRRDDAL